MQGNQGDDHSCERLVNRLLHERVRGGVGLKEIDHKVKKIRGVDSAIRSIAEVNSKVLPCELSFLVPLLFTCHSSITWLSGKYSVASARLGHYHFRNLS